MNTRIETIPARWAEYILEDEDSHLSPGEREAADDYVADLKSEHWFVQCADGEPYFQVHRGHVIDLVLVHEPPSDWDERDDHDHAYELSVDK